MPSPVEGVKTASAHLRGSIAAELSTPASAFTSDAATVLKFHGIYQQDDRDERRRLTAARQELAYICMVRTGLPGGRLTREQYLAADALAGEVADGSLRITTRQDLQFHFVHKGDLRRLVGALNQRLVSTLAACGDVVRNVVCCPAHLPGRDHDAVQAATSALSARFKPRSAAYYEVWIDGEKAITAEPAPSPPAAGDPEPIYGDAYLPRKFKIGFAFPGDNCTDVYSQDVGLVPIERHGEPGFQVLVGGGMGQSHAREDDTYPRLASPLAWVPDADLADAVEAIVTIHRDFGNREDRHRARLKYVVDERGTDWFRAEVERRVGHAIADPVDLPPWQDSADHLGWWQTSDGTWVLGVPVPSGRIRDRLRDALRTVVECYVPEVRLTTRQDVLLCGVSEADRTAIDAVLAAHGVAAADSLAPVVRHALACPALPTCGQALSEAERVLPGVIGSIYEALDVRGLGSLDLRVNMTGCPNGCARPYTAEVGIVGRTKSTYDVYVAGAIGGERLNTRVAIGVPLAQVAPILEPFLDAYLERGAPDEGFGDFCARIGVANVAVPVSAPRRRRESAA
jgi:sulfite reductase (ferredoxin)